MACNPPDSPSPATRLPRFGEALGHGASDRRIDILRGIALTGSISQAARETGVSYKAAWQAIDTLTNLAGVPLVRRAVGGAGGGGALLTAEGGHLLELAEALDAARRDVHARWKASNADSAVRTDAALARFSVRTSMRNQWPAVVETLDVDGRAVHVGLRLAPGAVVFARITQESVQLLGLREGMPVIALCKATSVRVTRWRDGDPVPSPSASRLRGRVTRTPGRTGRLDGESEDATEEVTMRVEGGLQWVGFAPVGLGLRARQHAMATVDAASIVIALPG